MDFLDSLDLHTTDEKSNRVRSWYLYEQYKSLEKNQLDAAKKLKNRSYQEKMLHRELCERRARRQFNEQLDLRHSKSHLEKSWKSQSSKTLYSESTDSLFESICEQDVVNEIEQDVVNEMEQDVVSEIEQDGSEIEQDTISQRTGTSKRCDEFKSSDDQVGNSCCESLTSIVENTAVNENIASEIKQELEFVKKNITEIINLQIETENECIEKYEMLCDDNLYDDESLKSIEKCNAEPAVNVDKYYPKNDNGLLAIWSKLVEFSYRIIQINRGNCYYDYSSQILTGVLAVDVLRRGINRMCHILQPYVSPIKFANDDYDESIQKLNQNHGDYKKSSKTFNLMYHSIGELDRNKNNHSLRRKYNSEDKWPSRCRCSFLNAWNHGASEPLRSVAKFSEDKRSFKRKLAYGKFGKVLQKDKSSYCKCQHLKKAINPIMELSHYINMILREIED